jgi:hypothetical protein
MYEVHLLPALQITHPPDNAREKKGACGGEPEASRPGKVAKPLRGCPARSRVQLLAVKGLHREDGVRYARSRERVERFGNKAAGGIVVF